MKYATLKKHLENAGCQLKKSTEKVEGVERRVAEVWVTPRRPEGETATTPEMAEELAVEEIEDILLIRVFTEDPKDSFDSMFDNIFKMIFGAGIQFTLMLYTESQNQQAEMGAMLGHEMTKA